MSRFFPAVALRGTANGAGGITGYLGDWIQSAGWPLASGKETIPMRIGFLAGTPVDTLHVTFALDAIEPATHTPAATLAKRTAAVTLVARSTPSAPDRQLTVTSGSTTSFRLTSRSADGVDPRFRHTQPTFGTVRDRGADGDATLGSGAVAVSERFAYSAPKDFLGTTSFTYTARDPGSELAFDQPPSSTGTISITVAQAPVLLRARLTPPTVTLGTPQKLTITAHTTGTPDSHLTVRLNRPGRTRTLVINNSMATVEFTESRAGAHRITIDYAGTATTEPGSIRLTDSIRRPG